MERTFTFHTTNQIIIVPTYSNHRELVTTFLGFYCWTMQYRCIQYIFGFYLNLEVEPELLFRSPHEWSYRCFSYRWNHMMQPEWSYLNSYILICTRWVSTKVSMQLVYSPYFDLSLMWTSQVWELFKTISIPWAVGFPRIADEILYNPLFSSICTHPVLP